MSEKNTQTELEAVKADENEAVAEVCGNDENEVILEAGEDDENEAVIETGENDINEMEIETENSETKQYVPKTKEEIAQKKKEDRKKAIKVLLSKTPEEDKKVSDKEKMESLMNVAMATEELRQLKKEHGIEEEPVGKRGKIARKVSNWFGRMENEEPIPVNKKKYIWMALLIGWFGGHRFYLKHYRVGLLYLVFFWTGMGFYNAVVDILIAIPMKPDENGNIML